MELLVGTCAKIDRVDLVRKAEDLGFSHFGVGEGPLLFSDPYQFLALAARDTATIQLGTLVTNPLTRLAPTTANSIATLNALAPGRTFLGFGAANNALRSMGQRTASPAEISQGLEVITRLLRGERAEFEMLGQRTNVELLDPASGWYDIAHPVPVWLAVGGPKGIDLAGRYADYCVYCLGPDPAYVQLVRQQLDEATARAGRPPGSVKLVALTWYYELAPGEGVADAVNNGLGTGPIVSALTNMVFIQHHAEELGAPLVEAAGRAAAAYLEAPSDPPPDLHLEIWRNYLRGHDPRHTPLVTTELVDEFALWGTPDDCRAKAQVMLDAGVDLIAVFLSNPATYDRDVEAMAATLLADAAVPA